ncbi:MAG: hypothetical protein AAFY46_08470, partial [Planctomycetota bacterium]
MTARLAAPLLPFVLAAGCASAPTDEQTAQASPQSQATTATDQPNASLAALPASTEPQPDNAFADALQPKTETGVDRFL